MNNNHLRVLIQMLGFVAIQFLSANIAHKPKLIVPKDFSICLIEDDFHISSREEILIVSSSSSSDDGNVVGNTHDGNFGTRWSAIGDGEWAQFDLGSPKNFNEVQIAFQHGTLRTSTFDLLVSNDGSTWSTVESDLVSSGTTESLESFVITNQYARYIRFVGHGNSTNNWNSILEIKIIYSVLPDTQSPTAPTLTSYGQSQDEVTLSWSGATDNIAVTGYNVFRDASLETTLGNINSYQVTGLTPSTSYDFTVTALDAVGNESGPSNVITVTTEPDSTSGGTSVWTEIGTEASYLGDVAIGMSSVPSGFKLAVEGKVRTREIRVDQDTWPDYVFGVDYSLKPLEEVEKYIQEYGRLPNMPAAEEVMVEGVELGEMNRLLLEKVEELTLYILEIKKELKELKDKDQ